MVVIRWELTQTRPTGRKENKVDIANLKHVRRPLKSGGQVVVLCTGAVITAEDQAMLQALYSRSPASIDEHLKKLAEIGSGKFMESFYVGYGHKSIGDCGNAVIFIEGVSMLVAKAIQDTMLYRGQECSTRYLDFSTQPFLDPIGSDKTQQLLTDLRAFYVQYLPVVKEHVAQQFPRQEGENEKTYDKAVAARAFDIMRAFLPAGALTSLSWTTDLRHAADRLMILRHHPLEEVKEVTEALQSALQEAYPHSFNHKLYPETEEFNELWMRGGYYLNTYSSSRWSSEATLSFDGINRETLASYRSILMRRPPKTDLPKQIGWAGTAQFRWLMDFGSYRDLQRHRAVIQLMPLLTTKLGFEEWYVQQLPHKVRYGDAAWIIDRVQEICDRLSGHPVQYLVPMGFQVQCGVTGDLPALVYLAELRSGSTVHPTMRLRAQQLGKLLRKTYGTCGLVVHLDESDMGRFDVRRGSHDITAKV